MHEPHGSFSARSTSPTIASIEPDVIALLIERYEAPLPACAMEGAARAAAITTAESMERSLRLLVFIGPSPYSPGYSFSWPGAFSRL
jgi:hypothetical protein